MEDEKLSGRVIIDTILANMRQQVEELRYSKIVPAAYDVYLHAEDQQRFESLAHEIAAEAVRALQEKLDEFNRPSPLDRVREVVRKPRLPYKKVGPWLVRITRDPDGAVPRGRALVVSQIALAGAESFEGQRTRRLATLSEDPAGASEASQARDPAAYAPRDAAAEPATQLDARGPAATRAAATLRETTEPLATAAIAENGTSDADSMGATARSPVLARLSWKDESGTHVHRMTGSEITVGRAAQGSTADVRLETLPDVSRTHFRVRHEPEHGRFSIEDLSMLGTSVNGERLARGIPTPLPTPAEIRLADAVTVLFECEALS